MLIRCVGYVYAAIIIAIMIIMINTMSLSSELSS